MVSEFPDLQGAMGRVYAKGQGEPAAVAEAIFEHYLPRGAEDGLPAGDDGALLGIADRLDQLTGFFGLGKEPSGTADPYGLRRAAIGLLRLVLAKRFRFDLAEALAQAQALHNAQGDRVSASPSLASTIWAFLAGRCEVLWRERGAPDTVQAVLGTGSRDLVSLQLRLDALTAERGSGASGQGRSANFEATCAAFKRIANINAQALEKKLPPTALNPALLAEGSDAERGLGQALAGARERMQRALGGAGPAGDGQAKEPPSREAGEDYPAAWAVLAELRPSVDRFFDEVMVMDPDTRKRDNRLALLRGLQEIFAPLADFSRLQAG